MPNKSWYEIQAKANSKEADVLIYDEIGFFGVTAKDLINELKGLDVNLINGRLNTPGGNVFDGMAIHNAFKNHPAKVIMHIEGVAASMGSVIAMAGDEIRMASNSFLMMHDAIGAIVAGADEMRQRADLLDKMNGSIATVYADRSGASEDHIKALMSAETWFTGEEALAEGLVDTVTGAVEVNASFDLSKFGHVPKDIAENFTGGQPSIRDLETALRDAGVSQVDAKTLLAKGYSALEHRDDATPPHRDDGSTLENKTDPTEEEPLKNLDELKAQHPGIYDEVFTLGVASVDVAAAVATAHKAEVDRAVDVRAQADGLPGFEKEIEAMATDGVTTGPQAAVNILALQKEQMNAAKDKIKKDAEGVDVKEAPTAALGAGADGEGKDFMSLVRACMKEENISKAKAISMTAKDHPKAHKAYVAAANKEEDE